MRQIQSITNDPAQAFTLSLPSGEQIQLELWYVPMQIGWFFSLSYRAFSVSCMRVTRNQNMLYQFSDLLPFGLACFTNDGREPLLLEDFAARNASLYVLDPADMAALEAFYGA